jgi:hypothetical protein
MHNLILFIAEFNKKIEKIVSVACHFSSKLCLPIFYRTSEIFSKSSILIIAT